MSEPEKVGVRMPELIVIPIGTRAATCGCGMYQYFVRDGDVTRSVSTGGKFYSKKAKAEITVPGCKPPTTTTPGLGFDHHIDCVQWAQFKRKRSRADTPDERAAKVRKAEELARKFGILCTGSVGVADCNGDAVVVFLIGGKLFATPCSAHADRVQKAIRDGARSRDFTMHALEEFLVDRGQAIAEQFATKARNVRRWHTDRGGITVPKSGHL